MRLTRAGEYGVRCVLYLSSQPEREVAKKKDVARKMHIPDQFLAKIAQQLAVAGIVELVQGSRGGMRLARAPESISLLEVVEAITGEIFLNDCVSDPLSCWNQPACSVHRVWSKARSQLRETLGQASFALLAQEGHCLQDKENGA